MHRVITSTVVAVLGVVFLISPVAAEGRWTGGRINLGWFTPGDAKAYGDKAYDHAKSVGETISEWGWARPDGFVVISISGGWYWRNGFGLEVSIRNPYYISIDCLLCPSYEYSRFVWPFLFITARYNLSKDDAMTPYVGAGAGGYYVSTSASGAYGSADNTDIIGGIHFVGGLQFGRRLYGSKRFFLEFRYETTISDVTETSRWFDDGGSLGGALINFGISL